MSYHPQHEKPKKKKTIYCRTNGRRHHLMNAHDVLTRARSANLRLVRFLYCDNGGIIRCKATHSSKLPTRIHEGIGHCYALGAWTGADTLASVEGMGPVGEFRLVPDPDTFTILPYVPNTGSMMCDQIDLDGRPWGDDLRGRTQVQSASNLCSQALPQYLRQRATPAL